MAKNPASNPPNKTPDLSFEESLAEVERIIEQIESGEVGLEASIGEYERGAKLIARCRGTLERAEQRIRELTSQDLSGDSSTDGGDLAEE